MGDRTFQPDLSAYGGFPMRWILVIMTLSLLACSAFMVGMSPSSLPPPEIRVVPMELFQKNDYKQAFEVMAFEELAAPDGEKKFQYFEITLDDGDGSAYRAVVKVKPSLIENWATKAIKDRLTW